MITIKDVAKLAQVSVGTVSNVFNKPELVTQDTIEKVKAIAEELGYYPSRIARGLAGSSTQLIGLVVSNIHNTVYSQIVKAVEATLKPYGYNVLLLSTEYDLKNEIEAVKVLLQAKVDGVIFGSTYSELKSKHLQEFIKRQVPVVMINRPIASGFDEIIWDTVQGSCDATSYLAALGHGNIGFIAGPLERDNSPTASQKRYEGYSQALKDCGLAINKEYVLTGTESTYDEGFRLTQTLISQCRILPTALFVAQDDMAIGAISALATAGIKVPADISVVGFSNHFYSRYSLPPLTTVDVPGFEAGRLASEIMIKRLTKEEFEPVSIVLPCKLIHRDSAK